MRDGIGPAELRFFRRIRKPRPWLRRIVHEVDESSMLHRGSVLVCYCRLADWWARIMLLAELRTGCVWQLKADLASIMRIPTMPFPFPGMDPYLEDPGLWPDVHHGLISEMQAALNRLLRPRYHARIEERVYISDENDPGRSVIVPDLRVAQGPGETGPRNGPTPITAEAVAAPVVATTLVEDEVHEARLEIVDRDQRTVVAVIEVLSPTNKVLGSRGQQNYQEKRQEVMKSTSHFAEIDLLRSGVGIIARETLPAHDYLIHVSPKERRPKGLIWPILLPQRLPVMPVPLKPDDPDVELDLAEVLKAAYERAAYDLQIDYRQEPVPPLPEQYRAWADELLSSKGLR